MEGGRGSLDGSVRGRAKSVDLGRGSFEIDSPSPSVGPADGSAGWALSTLMSVLGL